MQGGYIDEEVDQKAEGGMTEADMVTLRTPLGEESIQGGGIANVPTPDECQYADRARVQHGSRSNKR